MAATIILDANIIMDLTLQRTDDLDDLKLIYAAISDGIFRCYTTTSILHICGYWLKKAYGAEQSKKILLTLLHHVSVIDASHETVINALHSGMTDVEDAIQYYTALSHKVDYFISRDAKFIKSSRQDFPVYKPTDFINNFMR